MTIDNIQTNFVGMEPTDAIKEYCIEKISKYENLWKDATSIEVYLKENVNRRGVKNDFRIDINVFLPNAKVRVEQIGEDMYANIDIATDMLARRLKRYLDKRTYWEGEESWRILEAEIANDEIEGMEENDDYYSYIPKIVTRKEVSEPQAMEEAEAIEKMELSGYNQLLFNNRQTGRVAMVYKREQGDYGLVELID
jgi:ribosomal subunit interface protein